MSKYNISKYVGKPYLWSEALGTNAQGSLPGLEKGSMLFSRFLGSCFRMFWDWGDTNQSIQLGDTSVFRWVPIGHVANSHQLHGHWPFVAFSFQHMQQDRLAALSCPGRIGAAFYLKNTRPNLIAGMARGDTKAQNKYTLPCCTLSIITQHYTVYLQRALTSNYNTKIKIPKTCHCLIMLNCLSKGWLAQESRPASGNASQIISTPCPAPHLFRRSLGRTAACLWKRRRKAEARLLLSRTVRSRPCAERFSVFQNWSWVQKPPEKV